MNGVRYILFLLPGLVMLNVISSSYDESSSSLFQQRFQMSIQELLIAPLSELELLLGYLVGSILRGLAIGALVIAIGLIVLHATPQNGWVLFFMFVTSLLFSSIGMIAGLLAKTFDNLAIITTFVITPLTYVGGVFTSIHALPAKTVSWWTVKSGGAFPRDGAIHGCSGILSLLKKDVLAAFNRSSASLTLRDVAACVPARRGRCPFSFPITMCYG
jgi:ABC-type multidrug transport system permease subunit